MATAEVLLTAEQYRSLPDGGQPTELVRGRIVPLNMPSPRHGEICGRIVRLLGRYLDEHDIGRLVSNDSGVVTEREPDTVRAADVAFYSYARVPRGPLPETYLDVAPEVVFEVRSPGGRWREILAQVVEYLGAGVFAVCVLDPGSQTAGLYTVDQPERLFTAEEELNLPSPLEGFRVRVGSYFE